MPDRPEIPPPVASPPGDPPGPKPPATGKRDAAKDAASVRREAGVDFDAGRVFDAAEGLESFVRSHPDDAAIRADVAGLWLQIGMQENAADHLRYLVQRGRGGPGELMALADLTRPQMSLELCRDAIAKHPADLRPMIGPIRAAAYAGRWDEVVGDAGAVIAAHPTFAPAHIYRHLALVSRGDWATLAGVDVEGLPDAYWASADAAVVWGRAASAGGDAEAAAAWFGRGLRLDPNHRGLLQAMIDASRRTGDSEVAESSAERLGLLQALGEAASRFQDWRRQSQTAAVDAAEALRRLGRYWEAVAWGRAAASMPADPADDLASRLRPLSGLLDRSTPWQTTDALPLTPAKPGDGFDRDRWLHRSIAAAGSVGDAETSVGETAAFALIDEAGARGLDHVTRAGWDRDGGEGLFIWQSGIGGCGVIDIDADGWDDLLLTHADGTPRGRDSSPNAAFRNLDGNFLPADAAGLGDRGFTQGVAVGDYDGDGWPDVYVGNIGGDRLYRNAGDGTFIDVTTDVLPGAFDDPAWTSSAAIADVDGDGHADIVALHYCGGDDVLTRRCFDPGETIHRSCAPTVFDATPDDVYRGGPGGVMRRVALDGATPGRGLGLVVGELDDAGVEDGDRAGGIDLYIANDMTANHWWNVDASDRSVFRDQAFLRGVAVNARSVPQASMGIAVGDVDDDDRPDLLVTHFSDDHNTLYRQSDGGRFTDASTASGFDSPSRPMLGFGTQAVDLDVDGVDEFVIANGHVDDFTARGDDFEMPMQLMVRQSVGRYRWYREGVGAAFDAAGLRRTVVTPDVDRDGRPDVVTTGLAEPATLLMNRTPAVGRMVRVRLVGRRCGRDAVGAVVTLDAGGVSRTARRIAGNGYQCSEDPVLRFAAPADAGQVGMTLTVRWPDGSVGRHRFTDVAIGRDEAVVVQP